ncbi:MULTISPECIES: hypothetical protein [Burkholderiaceae]|nr:MULTISPECIES: hypothetical protein [Burkholderiaceae]MCF2134495.1 hypothetical protein [Mycetohabitans sp. B3]SIT65461.1 hypothetical protein SAMN04487769_0827 [Burkholderia sp. b14]
MLIIRVMRYRLASLSPAGLHKVGGKAIFNVLLVPLADVIDDLGLRHR